MYMKETLSKLLIGVSIMINVEWKKLGYLNNFEVEMQSGVYVLIWTKTLPRRIIYVGESATLSARNR